MKCIKSSKLIVLLIFGALLLSACSGNKSSGETEEVYQWSIGTIHYDPLSLKEYNSYGYGIQEFADLVNERSNGRMDVTIHWASTLGGDQELFQSVSSGEIDIYYGTLMSGADPRFGTWNLPYLFEDHNQVAQLLSNPDGEFFKLTKEWLKDHNIYFAAAGIGSFRGIVNDGHQVISPEDVSGLTLRTMESPLLVAFWSPLTNTVQMPASDIYMALETGAIDGLEFHASGVVGQQYPTLIDYYTDINWFINNAANIFISQESWDELPADLQEIVQQAAWDAMKLQGELELEDYNGAIAELKEMGMSVYELTPAERQVWIDHSRSLEQDMKEFVGEEIYNQVMELFK